MVGVGGRRVGSTASGSAGARVPAGGPVGRPDGAHLIVLAGLVVAEVVWIATMSSLRGGTRWLPVLVAVALHVRLVALERARPSLPAGLVLGAGVVVVMAATAVAPFGSHDLYQYAFYGRMVTEHHLNPYLVPPSAASGDALFSHLAPDWQDTMSPYGALFTGWSVLGAWVFGGSPLLARLFFQASAGAALVGGVGYLRWRGQPVWVLATVGLSPVLVAVVHGGHNDLVAGVLALVGLDLAGRGRRVAGPLVVALSCSVKLIVLPVAAAVVLVPLAARRWREAGRAAGLVGGVLVAGYLAVGGTAALAPLRAVGTYNSRGSLWNTLARLPGAQGLLGPQRSAERFALVFTVVGVAVLVWRAWPRPDAVALATGFGVVVCFGAAYILPWYPAAFLPLAALAAGSVAQRALTAGATVLLVVYVQPPGRSVRDLVAAEQVARLGGLALGVLACLTIVAARTSAAPPGGAGGAGGAPESGAPSLDDPAPAPSG